MPNRHPLDINVFDIVTLEPPDPAAGAGYTFGVPANSRVQIIGVSFTLTTDANAANRLPYCEGYDGALTFLGSSFNSPVVANSVVRAHFSIHGGGQQASGTYNFAMIALADHLYLRINDTLRINVVSIQAGDTITDIAIRYKQWVQE